jgi:undecaprenyl-diphosphatase
MTEILQWDEQLFHFINHGWQHPFLDAVIPLLRNKYFWMPLYVFLFSFFLLNFKKKGLLLVLALCLAVGISDVTSSQLIKKTVKRARPCKTVETLTDVHLLVPCGSGYSFPSSHAANHFTLAFFLFLALGKMFRWTCLLLMAWAASIALAQVYVGVHYPLDILAGAMLGMLIAGLVYLPCKKTLLPYCQD